MKQEILSPVQSGTAPLGQLPASQGRVALPWNRRVSPEPVDGVPLTDSELLAMEGNVNRGVGPEEDAALLVRPLGAAPAGPEAELLRAGAGGNALALSASAKDIKRPGSAGDATAQPKTPKEASKRFRREAENDAFIGGMRNPNAAVARGAGLRAIGGRVRSAFETFFGDHEEEL